MSTALKREFFTLKHNYFYVVYTLCFMVVAVLENCIKNEGTFCFTVLTILLSSLIGMNTMANEARFKFDNQATAFPTTPTALVTTKYILSFVFSLFTSGVLILIKQLLFVLGVSQENVLPMIPLFLAFFGGVLVLVAIFFIVAFALGAEKAVWVLIAFFCLGGFTTGFLAGLLEKDLDIIFNEFLQIISNGIYLWLIFIGGVVVYIASLPLSVKLYQHRVQK